MADDPKAGHLEKKNPRVRWLVGVILILMVLIFAYVLSHSLNQGSRDRKLSKAEIAEATSILKDTSIAAASARKDSAASYITGHLRPSSAADSTRFRKELTSSGIDQIIANLPEVSISSRSYFWLNTDWKFLEVIFWTLFGVLASVLYYISEAMREGNFQVREFYVYGAKFFYAPVISVVIVLSYSLLTTSSDVKYDSTSTELLVLSFVLGFFSGRAIDLLNRIKDVLFPGGKKEEAEEGVILAGRVDVSQVAPPIKKAGIPVTLSSTLDPSYKLDARTDDSGMYVIRNIKEGVYSLHSEVTSNNTKFAASVSNRKLTKDKKVDVENLVLTIESH